MKRTMLLCTLIFLQSCVPVGRETDALSTHQIIAEPRPKWVHWGQEAPIDVSEERVISHKPCQNPNN